MSLRVLIDGVALPEEEARAFWSRFSDYMEEHKGDLKGFANQEGLMSVQPKTSSEGALLVGSRSAAQTPYANATSIGGSRPPQPDRGNGSQKGVRAKNRGK